MQSQITRENQLKETRLRGFLLLCAAIFAIAMAYLESAVVVYLRRLYGITELKQALVSMDTQIIYIEAGRELATLIMLFMVAILAGKTLQSWAGYFLLLFGTWDIFYYFWLRVFIGWPVGWLDTDLLFMLPLPWWGPVLAPMLIAILMVILGVGLVRVDGMNRVVKPGIIGWVALALGVLIDLYVFMSDAIAALPASIETLSHVHMSQFNWPVYLLGLAMIGFFVYQVIKMGFKGEKRREE